MRQDCIGVFYYTARAQFGSWEDCFVEQEYPISQIVIKIDQFESGGATGRSSSDNYDLKILHFVRILVRLFE
jgi:hypothetical protein